MKSVQPPSERFVHTHAMMEKKTQNYSSSSSQSVDNVLDAVVTLEI
jgi:hypothetical protein